MTRSDFWCAFCIVLFLFAFNAYCRGSANSAAIAELHNLDVPWQEARFFDVVITTTDVQVSLDQLTVLP